MPEYPVETLDEYEDDGTMVDCKDTLAEAVVGHRIVMAKKVVRERSYWGSEEVTVITLDNGKEVELAGTGDCCAYTEVESFLLHPEMVDHIITGVGTTDGYQTWHIYADMGDVLKLKVNWSCGNPFYYGYGLTIQVKDVE